MDCCGINMKTLCEDFQCKATETKEGVRVEITPKDASKADALKAMFKACKDLGICKC